MLLTRNAAAVVGGINVHAIIALDGRDKKRLERMCRYLATSPIAGSEPPLPSPPALR